MKRNLLLCVLLGVVLAGSAQKIKELETVLMIDPLYNQPMPSMKSSAYAPHRFSIFGTVGYGTIRSINSDHISDLTQKTPSFNVGVDYTYQFHRNFGVSAGLSLFQEYLGLYSWGTETVQRFQVEELVDPITQRLTGTENYSARYSELPVQLHWFLPLSSKWRFDLSAGVAYGYKFDEKIDFEGTVQRSHNDVTFTNAVFEKAPEGYFKKHSATALGGVLVEYRISRLMGIYLGADIRYGLTDLRQSSLPMDAVVYNGYLGSGMREHIRNAALNAKVGVSFHVGKNSSQRKAEQAQAAYATMREQRREIVRDSLLALDKAAEQQKADALAREQRLKREQEERAAFVRDSLARANNQGAIRQEEIEVKSVEGDGNKELKRYNVVVGSFKQESNAVKLRSDLVRDGYTVFVAVNPSGMFRVIIVSTDSTHQAVNDLTKVRDRYRPKFQDIWILDTTRIK